MNSEQLEAIVIDPKSMLVLLEGTEGPQGYPVVWCVTQRGREFFLEYEKINEEDCRYHLFDPTLLPRENKTKIIQEVQRIINTYKEAQSNETDQT